MSSHLTRSARIASIRARQILDSRGRPTTEVDVELEDGSCGRASTPSGASTGRYEACELRDDDAGYFEGRGVRRAVSNVQREIATALKGRDARDQADVDQAMIKLDGTGDLGRLGANGILAASLAVARAAAAHSQQPLYRYLAALIGARASLPMPMTNILSGGAHAGRGMDLQDFLAMPVGATGYSQALEWIARVRTSAAQLMANRGLSTLLADEGGLSPGFADAEQALDLMMESIEVAGLQPGRDMAITLDVAASELYRSELAGYEFARSGRRLTGEQMVAYVAELCERYPIVSVEDPLDQDDWSHWRAFTRAFEGKTLQIVGDDLFVTNEQRIKMGVERKVGNAVLIKLNQNGTLTGALRAMQVARDAGYATIVSARSGETEDSFIADLAVGSGAGQIKIGSLRNSERQAKYNQLWRIEEDRALAFARFREG